MADREERKRARAEGRTMSDVEMEWRREQAAEWERMGRARERNRFPCAETGHEFLDLGCYRTIPDPGAE